ncbi:MAG: hypothetical protein HDS46_00560 [Bacteroides sp.]|nr:hypothetical protein [Bacteroides sp.]
MKRIRIFAIIFMTLLSASLPLSVSGQTVIYKGMSSPNFSDQMTSDEAMIAAMVGMGYTTVSYIGDGVYKLEVTTGKKRLVADFVDSAEVVNNQKVTFRYKMSDSQVATITMTPDEIDLGGALKLILTEKSAFPGLVKAIRANNSKSPGKSSSPLSVPSGTASGSYDLTPVDAVSYPFGFLPSETKRISDALSPLRQAGWKADITKGSDSEMIYIISSNQFKIPYRMFGKAVTAMSVFGLTPPGDIMSYDVEINDYKQNWTAEDAETFAWRIVEDLKSAGYTVAGSSHLGRFDFYKYELTGNGLTVTVRASEGSKVESLDAYVVRLSMEKNKQ